MSYEQYTNPLAAVLSAHGLIIAGALLIIWALGGRLPALRFIALVIGLIWFLWELNALPFGVA